MDFIIEPGNTIGTFAADGSVEVEAVNSPFSNQYTRGIHHTRFRVENTLHFYYILTDENHLVSEEWHRQFADAVRSQFGQSGTPAQAAPSSFRSRKPVQAEDKPEE